MNIMNNDSEIVQYIIVRNDLGMSPGKVAAQVGHGVELAIEKGSRYYPQWTPNSKPCAKIVLQANKEQMDSTISSFHEHCLAKVIDEGRTEVPPGSLTVLALVPMPKYVAKSRFAHLKLY